MVRFRPTFPIELTLDFGTEHDRPDTVSSSRELCRASSFETLDIALSWLLLSESKSRTRFLHRPTHATPPYTHSAQQNPAAATMPSERDFQINPIVQESVVHNTKVSPPKLASHPQDHKS